jgi:hypothetical protein
MPVAARSETALARVRHEPIIRRRPKPPPRREGSSHRAVVLTTLTVEGESGEAANVLTYSAAGKLVAFEQIGDPAIADRVFTR